MGLDEYCDSTPTEVPISGRVRFAKKRSEPIIIAITIIFENWFILVNFKFIEEIVLHWCCSRLSVLEVVLVQYVVDVRGL